MMGDKNDRAVGEEENEHRSKERKEFCTCDRVEQNEDKTLDGWTATAAKGTMGSRRPSAPQSSHRSHARM